MNTMLIWRRISFGFMILSQCRFDILDHLGLWLQSYVTYAMFKFIYELSEHVDVYFKIYPLQLGVICFLPVFLLKLVS